jgi:hypothetical protein
MGIDIHGRRPLSPKGKEFYCSIGVFGALVDLMRDLCPVEYQVRGGWNKERSLRFAETLEKILTNGSAEKWIAHRSPYLYNVTLPLLRELQEFVKDSGGFKLP